MSSNQQHHHGRHDTAPWYQVSNGGMCNDGRQGLGKDKAYQGMNHHEYHPQLGAPPLPNGDNGEMRDVDQQRQCTQDVTFHHKHLHSHPRNSLVYGHLPYSVNGPYQPYGVPPNGYYTPYYHPQFTSHRGNQPHHELSFPNRLLPKEGLASEYHHDVQRSVIPPSSSTPFQEYPRDCHGEYSATTKPDSNGENVTPAESAASEYGTRGCSTKGLGTNSIPEKPGASPKEVMGPQAMHDALAVENYEKRRSISERRMNAGVGRTHSDSSFVKNHNSLHLPNHTPKNVGKVVLLSVGNTSKGSMSDVTGPSTENHNRYPNIPHNYLPKQHSKIDYAHCRNMWSYAHVLCPHLGDTPIPEDDNDPKLQEFRSQLRLTYDAVKKLITEHLIVEAQEFCDTKKLPVRDSYQSFGDMTSHVLELCKIKEEDTGVLDKSNLSIVLKVGQVLLTERTGWIEDKVEPKFEDDFRVKIVSSKTDNFLHQILSYMSIGMVATFRRQMINKYGLAYYLRHPKSLHDHFGNADVGILKNVTVVCGDVKLEGHVYYIMGEKCIDVATSEAFQMGCKMVKLLENKRRDELDKYVGKIWELVS